MMTIDDIRRQNIAILVDRHGGVRRLAEMLDMSESQLSQLLNGARDSRSKKPRGMRAVTARRIEAACLVAEGWLDTLHASEASGMYSVTPIVPGIALDDALRRIGEELAQVPVENRQELADNLRLWAMYGGKSSHLVAVRESLTLPAPAKQRTGT